ncbi:MAG: heme o synthase [Planctomycetota bacterium]|nr:heme o synthase [Planctomycetota bacterium]
MRASVAVPRSFQAIARARVADYVEMTKPGIALTVLFTALVGFVLASQAGLAVASLVHVLFGVALVAGGASALNQVLERDTDSLMRRTERRPLPSGRVLPGEGMAFGVALSIGGVIHLAIWTNILCSLLAAATVVGYVWIYTPLKKVTPLSTIVGAVPGAMPPLIGWAAARGSVGPEAWLLFSIMVIWQLPHFLAIAWIYREDYERAGLPVLAVVDPEGEATGRQILNWSLALLPVSLLPTVVGITGPLYFVGAFLLGVGLLILGVRAARRITTASARSVFLASVIYIPALFLLMVIDRV